MRCGITRLGLAAALLVGLSAAAPGAVRGEPTCTCRYAGQSYAVNACVCIVTSSGARMACCAKVLNNSSWTFIGDVCPVAAAPAEDSPRSSAAPRQASDSMSRLSPAATVRLALARFFL